MSDPLDKAKVIADLRVELEELREVRSTLEGRIEDMAQEIRELEDKVIYATEQLDSISSTCNDMLRSLK